MQLRDLKLVSKNTPQPHITIYSDGSDYVIQVLQQGQLATLRDQKGKRLVLKNLTQAQQLLAEAGIHNASLKAIPANDTPPSPRCTQIPHHNQMLLSF